ncbi:hypothetical protein BS47DRAFT_1369511 [Hydnum rufescens UP504]|uniref:Uncharacterized protein n=1 Tax=Hydnum rufescens UP504 TaxID=1448309 RepID=A0A9P6ADR4_9AGAM|nr:hypothetical protein BS47DRAFT_1369511 [Hydnum rufescens UP504]
MMPPRHRGGSTNHYTRGSVRWVICPIPQSGLCAPKTPPNPRPENWYRKLRGRRRGEFSSPVKRKSKQTEAIPPNRTVHNGEPPSEGPARDGGRMADLTEPGKRPSLSSQAANLPSTHAPLSGGLRYKKSCFVYCNILLPDTPATCPLNPHLNTGRPPIQSLEEAMDGTTPALAGVPPTWEGGI